MTSTQEGMLPSGPNLKLDTFRTEAELTRTELTGIPRVKFNDGHSVPAMAFGTSPAWAKRLLPNREVVTRIKSAIKNGFLHIDTAENYGTEEEVGIAIKESGVPREKLFITTKVGHQITDIRASAARSLKNLQLDYVDLYLIHSPYYAKDGNELSAWWAVMEELQREGKARSIGVSNFTRAHLETIIKSGTVVPANNQMEYHPYLQRSGDFVPWMQKQGIVVSCFKGLAPLTVAKGGPLDPVLERIAKKHGVSESQVLLKWHQKNGVLAVTTTTNEDRIADYIKAPSLQLTDEEVQEISSVGRTHHFRQFAKDKFAEGDRS